MNNQIGTKFTFEFSPGIAELRLEADAMSRIRKKRGPLRSVADEIFNLAELEDIAPPLSEPELIARWQPTAKCLVSICMLTYNHAPWLRNTLTGILNQETDFGFEILIHDDASTDGTQEIIREFQARYPRIVKPIFQEDNKWSRGINPSIAYNYPRAKAEFVAWCEGDDMWIDKQKLSIQVQALQTNPSVNLAFHQAIEIHYGLKAVKPRLIGNYSNNDRLVSFHEVIHRPYGLIPTASCMVRSGIKERLHKFMKFRPYIRGGDIFMQMLGAMGNGAVYHARPMSIYRFQTRHSLTRGMQNDVLKQANHQAAAIRAYLEINHETNGALTRELKTLILQRILWLFNRKPIPPVAVTALNLNTLLKEYLKIKRTIHRKIAEINTCPTNHIIYGIASGCTLIMEKIDHEKVLAFIDRDCKWVGEKIFEKYIVPESEIGNFKECNLIVSILAPDKGAVERLVNEHSFPADRILYFFDDLVDAIDIELLSHDGQGAPDPEPRAGQPPGWWPRRSEQVPEPGEICTVSPGRSTPILKRNLA